ncbi:MAG: AraC family transcriptional regulator [Bacteroidota bacterium]|nr:AraC family transcriptional regulator [Bacteroidota bacterium]
MLQHIEFIDRDHFEEFYFRKKAAASLSLFIDFFWETRFESLWEQHPDGFSDVLFPNTGYTYLINLGTPFVMQVAEKKFPMKSDGFLPRHQAIECFHSRGNKIFGIKFKTSPIIFEKKINFSEYRESIFPLSYLVDPAVLQKVKLAGSFSERISLLSGYFNKLIEQYEGSLTPVHIVTRIISDCDKHNHFNQSVEVLAAQYHISPRTLQRYFEMVTGISTKNVLQIMRIRKAVEKLVAHPASFDYKDFGYYDQSHFQKHLKQFLKKNSLQKLQPHRLLLDKACT